MWSLSTDECRCPILAYSRVIAHGVEIKEQAGDFRIEGGIAHDPHENGGHCVDWMCGVSVRDPLSASSVVCLTSVIVRMTHSAEETHSGMHGKR